MAIVEDIPDEESPVLRSRGKPSKSQSKSGSKSRTREEDINIPLRYPSEIPHTDDPPLINVLPPDAIPPGATFQTVSSAEEIERLQASLGHESKVDEHEDEIFNTLIMAVPFTFLYLLLDILVHLQYSHRPSFALLFEHVIKAMPTLTIVVWYTNRYPQHFLTNPLLMAASILAGCRMIWLVNKASWSVVTAQAPSMGTLWILTIIQLPLSRALIALAIVGGWLWRSGLKISP